jgi:hypothetical protein
MSRESFGQIFATRLKVNFTNAKTLAGARSAQRETRRNASTVKPTILLRPAFFIFGFSVDSSAGAPAVLNPF